MRDLEQRQKIFEDVIIQRIKILQNYVKTKIPKAPKDSASQRTDSKLLDEKVSVPTKQEIENQVEEAVKWKLEATLRKNED